MAGPRVVNWNGNDVPEELRDLPPGRYVLEAVDEPPVLSEAEDAGLAQALASLREGKGRTVDEVRSRIDSLLRR